MKVTFDPRTQVALLVSRLWGDRMWLSSVCPPASDVRVGDKWAPIPDGTAEWAHEYDPDFTVVEVRPRSTGAV